MTVYPVFPGVALNYNDFHMEYFESGFVPAEKNLVVDHCRKGRPEYAAAENAVAYMSQGYEAGPTAARKTFQNELKAFQHDLDRIMEKFALGEWPRGIINAFLQAFYDGGA